MLIDRLAALLLPAELPGFASAWRVFPSVRAVQILTPTSFGLRCKFMMGRTPPVSFGRRRRYEKPSVRLRRICSACLCEKMGARSGRGSENVVTSSP